MTMFAALVLAFALSYAWLNIWQPFTDSVQFIPTTHASRLSGAVPVGCQSVGNVAAS
eukprot:COSAG02_NODE_2400_length_8948_cov_6.018759_2_plen_57_part_00